MAKEKERECCRKLGPGSECVVCGKHSHFSVEWLLPSRKGDDSRPVCSMPCALKAKGGGWSGYNLSGASLDGPPALKAASSKEFKAAETVRLKTISEKTGVEDENELVRIREMYLRHVLERAYFGIHFKDWRESWEDFWRSNAPEILGEEKMGELLDEIDVDHESMGPDRKRPESGIKVKAGARKAEITEWRLLEPPDTEDKDALEAWKAEPFLRIETVVPMAELMDTTAVHRGTYSGDDKAIGLVDVAVMKPEAQSKAVVAAAIAYIGYYGGTESRVERIGD